MQPNTQQVGGILTGVGYTMWDAYDRAATILANTSPEWEIAKAAIIGATVGFIATTILRLIWDNVVARYGKKFKFLKPKK